MSLFVYIPSFDPFFQALVGGLFVDIKRGDHRITVQLRLGVEIIFQPGAVPFGMFRLSRRRPPWLIRLLLGQHLNGVQEVVAGLAILIYGNRFDFGYLVSFFADKIQSKWR